MMLIFRVESLHSEPAVVCWIIVLLHHGPVWSKLLDSSTSGSRTLWSTGVHGPLGDCKELKPLALHHRADRVVFVLNGPL